MFSRLGERAVDVAIGQIQGYFTPTKAERAAAWELLVELSTRTTVAPLHPEHGLIREAMDSIYSMYGTTRTVLKQHGIDTGKARNDGNLSLAVIAVRMLNDVIRPVLSEWHPRLSAREDERPKATGPVVWETDWEHATACRAALNELRVSIRAYLDTLGRIAGTPAVAAAVTPMPPSQPIRQQSITPVTPPAGAQPRQRMTRWIDLAEMLPVRRAHKRATLSGPSGPTAAGPALAPFGCHATTAPASLWVDYVADLGDGFDATMAVAWQLAQPSITLPPHPAEELPRVDQPLARGSLLVLGGDQVYPWASEERYANQLVLPYHLAAQASGLTDCADERKPAVLAVPGNHDWLGGIAAFDSLFLDQAQASTFAGGWKTFQTGRYAAVPLAHGWWLWSFDTGLDNTVDPAQASYFAAAGTKLRATDRVIVCTPVPLWQLRQRDEAAYAALRGVIDRALLNNGAQAPLYLSGDSHMFAHYRYVDTTDEHNGEHHVTSGGGGAFLQPTHNLPEQIPYEHSRSEFVLNARWPLPADSRALSPGHGALADRQARFAVPALALVHVLFAAAATYRPGWLDPPEHPGPGVLDALRWLATAPLTWPCAAAVVLVGVALTAANSKERGVRAGAARYGTVLGLAEAVTLFVFAAAGRWERLDAGWWWRFGLVPLAGGFVSLVLFLAGTRAINARIRASDNLAFAVGHLTRFKHFLRLRIDADGALTLYAVGLDPVGSGWWTALTGVELPRRWWQRMLRRRPHRPPSGLVPPFDPAGTPRLHYLWGLALPATPTAAAATAGNDPAQQPAGPPTTGG